MMPGYWAVIRSIAARLEGDFAAAIRHAEHALTLLPPGPGPLQADVLVTLGHALIEAGELDRALEAYAAARPAERAQGNWMAVADSTRNLARLEARRGRLGAALEVCDEELAGSAGAMRRAEPTCPRRLRLTWRGPRSWSGWRIRARPQRRSTRSSWRAAGETRSRSARRARSATAPQE